MDTPKRYKVYKNKETRTWHIQEYGTNTAGTALTFQTAILASQPYSWAQGYVRAMAITTERLQQDEDTCPLCGRHVVVEEHTHPGGGGHFNANCINDACDYEYSDGF